jgi:tellurite resistance protein TerC
VLYVALGALAAVLALVYWLEARDARRQPAATTDRVRRAALWSAAWLALGLAPIAIFGAIQGGQSASAYAAVYMIERALSLDNVFVFAVLISAFAIPASEREELVSWGALAAFVLRIPAIFLGVALFDASHLVGYALGALLIVLAWQTARSAGEEGAEGSRVVSWLRRRLPVGEGQGRRLIVVRDGRRMLTPVLLCLIAIMFADLTFAVDSIPAALAISHDRALILTANLLALLGLRALFQLVAVARESLRYMDQTIAVLLALVGVKLLTAHVYEVSPLASLFVVLVVLGAGVGLSMRAGSRSAREADRRAALDD